jgi:hypothetical protein
MSTELQHVINSIENSNFRNSPYEHCLIENIFSEEFYEELINNLPNDDKYSKTEYISESRDGNPTRYKFSLKNPQKVGVELKKPLGDEKHPLQILSEILISQKVYDAFSNLFSNINKFKNIHVNAYLFRDKAGYSILPHPDANYKVLTFILYLPKDNLHKDVGTIINTKEDGQFIKHDLVEYKRNSGLAFPVTDTSFHSVDTVTHKNFNRDMITNFYAVDNKFMTALV